MKKTFLLASFVLLMAFVAVAQCGGEKAAAAPAKSEAASQLYFVFLNRPASRPEISKEKIEELQEGHMANIRRLYGEGKLLVAGPFMDDTALRGIFVFQAASAGEVKEWLATDPALHAGRMVADVHAWHPAMGEIHHPTENQGMENYVMLIYRWSEKSRTAITKEEIRQAMQGHKKYQLGLFEADQTVIGGPFTDNDKSEFIGVVVAHGSAAEGEKLAAADPAVKAGVATVEVHPWIAGRGVLGKAKEF